MLRILFCISCCGVPPSSRASARKVSSSVAYQKDDETKGTDNKTVTSEKDQLLDNQIRTINDNYGLKGEQDKISSPIGDIATITKNLINSDDPSKSYDQNPVAGSSSRQLKRQAAFDSADTNYENYDINAGARQQQHLQPHDDQNVSPPSSIDIDLFTESPTFGDAPVPRERFEAQLHHQHQAGGSCVTGSGGSGGGAGDTVDQIEAAMQMSAAKNVPCKTKIGDYARIEYSPVDDLELFTTTSHSHGESEWGGPSQTGSALSRQNSWRLASTIDGDFKSRRSSQGIESTSISIASQLSNEQLQQNLTNVLESATNSPMPLFGTIGLPLGPPLEGALTETAKTSPETLGAALTSASQDSLSDNPLGQAPAGRPTLSSYTNTSSGAALVGDSMERSYNDDNLAADLAATATAPLATDDLPPLAGTEVKPTERNVSPQSITTTGSGGLANPTPTPSEMSGSSSIKKRKLRVKSLWKKLSPRIH